MYRVLGLFVGFMLAAGVVALATGEPAAQAAPREPGGSEFGFALAAGAVALAVTFLVARPRWRFRR